MDYTKFVIQYRKNGWVPVKWSHHPEHIKNAIKAVKFRPQAKQCFANSQKLDETSTNNSNAASNPKKLVTITCIKGKSKKLVTGDKPKCPTGYKIVKN